jgi:hypothetical protein
MRIAGRLLAILTIAALLAPGVRWAAVRAGGEACACPPAACTCPGHQHNLGHASKCGMANGGQCGLDSPHDFVNSQFHSLVFIPTAHQLPGAPVHGGFGHFTSQLNLLPSHARPLDQPPRLAL